VTEEAKKSWAIAAGVGAGVAMVLVLQKAFNLTGGNSVIWAVPCIFVAVATYNLLKPGGSKQD
jgi:hypothetical protein